MTQETEVDEKVKELVIARIDAKMPSNIKISIGSTGSLSKEQMIEHVRKGDKEGKEIVQMHLNFIKAITSGHLMKEINSI